MPSTENETVLETCASCISDFESEHGGEYSNFAEAWFCQDCIDNHYRSCEMHDGDWDAYEFHDDWVYIDYDGWYCYTCLDNGTVFNCVDCGEYFHERYYGGDTCCVDCYDDRYHDVVRGYHDRPPMIFINDHGGSTDYPTEPYYLGAEIEIEGNVRDILVNHIENHNAWLTTDGSLNQGLELVTFPATLSAWNAGDVLEWRDWQYLHEAVPDQSEYTSNGIHVHVSRSAFTYMRNGKAMTGASHMYRFMKFFTDHYQAFQIIAGRSHSSYATWDNARDIRIRKDEVKGHRSGDRYRPINTQNHNTIELRFFNGLTDPSHIRKCIQTVHSVIEYTRKGSIKDMPTWLGYERYLGDNSELYPDLLAFIREQDDDLYVMAKASVISSRDQRKQVHDEMKIAYQRAQRSRYERNVASARQNSSITSDSGCDCWMCRNYDGLR